MCMPFADDMWQHSRFHYICLTCNHFKRTTNYKNNKNISSNSLQQIKIATKTQPRERSVETSTVNNQTNKCGNSKHARTEFSAILHYIEASVSSCKGKGGGRSFDFYGEPKHDVPTTRLRTIHTASTDGLRAELPCEKDLHFARNSCPRPLHAKTIN